MQNSSSYFVKCTERYKDIPRIVTKKDTMANELKMSRLKSIQRYWKVFAWKVFQAKLEEVAKSIKTDGVTPSDINECKSRHEL